MKNNYAVNNISYQITITDPDRLMAIVSLIDDRPFNVKEYNVNASARSCDCGHYVQSGVPCYHFIALFRFLNKNINKSYFYEFCHMDNLKAMFEKSIITTEDNQTFDTFTTLMPTMEDLDKLLDNNDNFSKYKLLPTVVAIDANDKSCISSKRYLSRGETKKGKGVYNSTSRRKCSICSKIISKKTKHPSSACAKYYKRIFMKELQVTSLDL